MLLKEEQDRSVKGRACADGRKQREKMDMEESALPTAADKSVIPGAFLHAINDNSTVIMLLEGTLVELMVKVSRIFTGSMLQLEKVGGSSFTCRCTNTPWNVEELAAFLQKAGS